MRTTQISEGRTIYSWKYTPGPSVKEYDFWEHVIAAFGSGTKSLGLTHALEEVEWVSPGTAFSWFMQGKYNDGEPWGHKKEDPHVKEWFGK